MPRCMFTMARCKLHVPRCKFTTPHCKLHMTRCMFTTPHCKLHMSWRKVVSRRRNPFPGVLSPHRRRYIAPEAGGTENAPLLEELARKKGQATSEQEWPEAHTALARTLLLSAGRLDALSNKNGLLQIEHTSCPAAESVARPGFNRPVDTVGQALFQTESIKKQLSIDRSAICGYRNIHTACPDHKIYSSAGQHRLSSLLCKLDGPLSSIS